MKKMKKLRKLTLTEFLKIYAKLKHKGWERDDSYFLVSLRKPGGRGFNYSPLSAVLFYLTGKTVKYNANGSLFRAFQRAGWNFKWDSICVVDDASSKSWQFIRWRKSWIKEKLMSTPVAKIDPPRSFINVDGLRAQAACNRDKELTACQRELKVLKRKSKHKKKR